MDAVVALKANGFPVDFKLNCWIFNEIEIGIWVANFEKTSSAIRIAHHPLDYWRLDHCQLDHYQLDHHRLDHCQLDHYRLDHYQLCHYRICRSEASATRVALRWPSRVIAINRPCLPPENLHRTTLRDQTNKPIRFNRKNQKKKN